MAKKESTLGTMILSLLLITAAASAALAGVYKMTEKSITEVQNQKKQQAIQAVLHDFNGELQRVGVLLDGDPDSVYVSLAYQQDQCVGAAVETYTKKAFGGSFTLMVGFDANGEITGTEVIKMAETPGLGDKINKEKSDFSKQFVTMNPAEANFDLKVKKDGGTVDAITAATISSRAYCDAVNRAAKAFDAVNPNKQGGDNE